MAQTAAIAISPNPPIAGQAATITLTSTESRTTPGPTKDYVWTLDDGTKANLGLSGPSTTDAGTLVESPDPQVWTVESDNGFVRVIQTPSWQW